MSKKFHAPGKTVFVCIGSKCEKNGGKDIYKAAKKAIKDAGKKGKVAVIKTYCTDNCKFAPVVNIQPANEWLSETNIDEVQQKVKDL